MQYREELREHLCRKLSGCGALAGSCKAHTGAEELTGDAGQNTELSHAHGHEQELRVQTVHLLRRCEKSQHVSGTLRHHSELGDIRAAALHGEKTLCEYCLFGGLLKIVT